MAEKKLSDQTAASTGARVKKVQPYPFDIEIVQAEGTPPIKGEIMKLTDKGFLMRTKGQHHFKVGDNHQARFLLPVSHHAFNEPVKVIKTYDSADVGQDKKSLHKHFTIEMHFRGMTEKKIAEILKFTTAIGQK